MEGNRKSAPLPSVSAGRTACHCGSSFVFSRPSLKPMKPRSETHHFVWLQPIATVPATSKCEPPALLEITPPFTNTVRLRSFRLDSVPSAHSEFFPHHNISSCIDGG